MILLLGSTGYIGEAFSNASLHPLLRKETLIPMSRAHLDYTNYRALREFLSQTRVSFVINAAGYTGKPNVDACEIYKGETIAGNVALPLTVAQACDAVGIPCGHVSSGCIYSGSPNKNGWTEGAIPNFSFETPVHSFYSGTKALAEELLRNFEQIYIWRLRIPFDQFDSSRNYISKLLRYPKLLEATNSISHREDFVRACLDLRNLYAPYGIYNITNPGAITTSYVVERIKKYLKPTKSFEFWKSEEEFYAKAAKTPRSNCVLDSSKLLKVPGIKMRSAADAIDDALNNWKPE